MEHKAKMSEFEKPKVIAVDVDDTLVVDGVVNQPLIDWLRLKKEEGFVLILWSMAGRDYAVDMAKRCGCYSLFNSVIPKPGYIVDDDGWNWTQHTEVIDPDLKVVKQKKFVKKTSGRAIRARHDKNNQEWIEHKRKDGRRK